MRLNADVGEGFATDNQLFPFLDQANIACGGHTGDHQTMQQAVLACIDNKVSIGAHPSYPDVENFGRVSIDIEPALLVESLQHQIQSLVDVCTALGARLGYIKPHGALYNDMMAQADLFNLVLDIVLDFSSKLDLMLGAALPEKYTEKAKKVGVSIIREAFSDRQYLSNGQLVPRSQKGAVFKETVQICKQVADLKTGIVRDKQGAYFPLKAESICIHGDNPASVQVAPDIALLLKS